MKAIVLKKFKDIKTGEIHKKDDIITCSKTRFEEILKNGQKKGKGNLVKELEEKEDQEAEKSDQEEEKEDQEEEKNKISEKGAATK